jgi:hypothetical protein
LSEDSGLVQEGGCIDGASTVDDLVTVPGQENDPAPEGGRRPGLHLGEISMEASRWLASEIGEQLAQTLPNLMSGLGGIGGVDLT